MKGFWKYLLIFIGVLVVAFIVGLFVFRPMLGSLGGFGMPFSRMPMMRSFDGRFGPGLVGFGLIRFAFACLGPLFILALLGFGIYLLVRPKVKVVEPVAPIFSPAAVPVTPPAAGPVVTPTNPCPHCGKPLQADWVACPFCGEKLSA